MTSFPMDFLEKLGKCSGLSRGRSDRQPVSDDLRKDPCRPGTFAKRGRKEIKTRPTQSAGTHNWEATRVANGYLVERFFCGVSAAGQSYPTSCDDRRPGYWRT